MLSKFILINFYVSIYIFIFKYGERQEKYIKDQIIAINKK